MNKITNEFEGTAASAAPTWNDAQLRGTDCDEWQALLDREITIFTGDSGKLTRWPTATATWRDFIEGDPGAGGFSHHRQTARKSSLAVVMASFTGKARKAAAVTHIHALGLDFDSGTNRAAVESRIDALGVGAIVYTTFTHQKTESSVAVAQIERAFPDVGGDLTDDQLRIYLQDHDTTVYSDAHIDSTTIIDHTRATDDGLKVIYSHAPLDKFRVIFPFAESVDVTSLGRDLNERKSAWADKVVGAARAWLDGHLDMACTDLNRVFYMPEHRRGTKGEITIFQGPPVSLGDIPSVPKRSYNAEFRTPVTQRGTGGDAVFPSGENAKRWVAQHGEDLLIAEMIRQHAPDRIKQDKGDLLEIECPIHGSVDSHDRATHVRDADGAGGGFQFGCKRGRCSPYDRLDFLAAALREWSELDERLIWHAESEEGFLLPAPDDDDSDDDVIEDDDLSGLDRLRSGATEQSGEPQTAQGGTREPPSGGGDDGSTKKPRKQRKKQPRRVVDDLFDYDLLDKDTGFVKGKDKKLDKNIRAVRYQMQDKLREEFDFVIIDNSDARIFRRNGDGKLPTIFTKAGFSDLLANEVVPFSRGKKVQFIHPAVEFRTDPMRGTYVGTQFEPDLSNADPDKFNMWSGFAVTPIRGDWSLLCGHVRDQIIAGNESPQYSADYLFAWWMTRYAHMFQFPGEKLDNCITYMGGEGVGKSKLCDWMRKAVGDHSFKVAHRTHLTGGFNSHLDGMIYVVGEEASHASDKAGSGALKDMTSGEDITITYKGRDSVQRQNKLRIDQTTNEDWSVPTGDNGDARRFFVLRVNDNRKQDKTFFAAIDRQMRDGGLAAMVYDLMNWNPADAGLDWSDLRTVPWTPSRGEQATQSLAGPPARLKAIIDAGCIAGRTAGGTTFYYDLNDEQETVVARPHLNAAMTDGGKAYGGVGKKIQAAIENMLGEKASNGTKVKVEYHDSDCSDAVPIDTIAKTVTFPPLDALKTTVAQTYG